jgi:hypothetical protein
MVRHVRQEPFGPDRERSVSASRQPKWKPHNLAVGDIRERPEYQVRSGGVSLPHVNTLARAMESEGDLAPISVAKIRRAHWVVDGFHRLAAARKLGWSHISADVATMTAEEARDFALLANTKHGKRLGRADKTRLFDEYLALGKHVGGDGVVKASRVIEGEVNHIYSHETIRGKLKAAGVEVDVEVEYPNGFRPYGTPEDDEADLALELKVPSATLTASGPSSSIWRMVGGGSYSRPLGSLWGGWSVGSGKSE